MIDANIIQPLAHLLATAEFDIRKEAAWAISNATSGGTQDQIKFLVSAGCIKPLCDLLTCADVRIITVALEGLENILKVGYSLSSGMPHSMHVVWPADAHMRLCLPGYDPANCRACGAAALPCLLRHASPGFCQGAW